MPFLSGTPPAVQPTVTCLCVTPFTSISAAPATLTLAIGGLVGAVSSKVTKDSTTESPLATWTFTCSGMPMPDVHWATLPSVESFGTQ